MTAPNTALRERIVAALVEDGAVDKTIAHRLGTSVETIKHHIGILLREHACRNRTELVVRFLRRELVETREHHMATNTELFTALTQVAEIYGLEMPLHPVDELAAKIRAHKLAADRRIHELEHPEEKRP